MAKKSGLGALAAAFIRGVAKAFDDKPVRKVAPRRTHDTPLPHSPGGKRVYPVGIVGESNCQPAIQRCRVGEAVQLLHEPGNPHDTSGRAIAVESSRGETIGYIAREHWLKEPLLDDGKGCTARISEIGRGDGASLGVVLSVSLEGAAIGKRVYRRG